MSQTTVSVAVTNGSSSIFTHSSHKSIRLLCPLQTHYCQYDPRIKESVKFNWKVLISFFTTVLLVLLLENIVALR